jgi:hypothetical protein
MKWHEQVWELRLFTSCSGLMPITARIGRFRWQDAPLKLELLAPDLFNAVCCANGESSQNPAAAVGSFWDKFNLAVHFGVSFAAIKSICMQSDSFVREWRTRQDSNL